MGKNLLSYLNKISLRILSDKYLELEPKLV